MQMLQGSPTGPNEMNLASPFFAMTLPTVDQGSTHISQFESTPSLSGESPIALANSQDVLYSAAQIQFETSFLDPNSDDDNSPVSIPSKRGSKNHVSSACINCKRAHLACDVSRPCKRCVTLGKEDSCHDIAHKKRGRPKLRDKASLMQSHFLANERKYEIMYDSIQTPVFATSAQRVNRPQPPSQEPQPSGRIAFVHQTLQEFHEQQQQQQREEEEIHERIIRRSFSKGSDGAERQQQPQPQQQQQQPSLQHQPFQHPSPSSLDGAGTPSFTKLEHTHYLSSIDFNPSNLLAEGPDSNEVYMPISPIQSSHTLALPIAGGGNIDLPILSREQLQQQQPQVTIFMSMEVCCARASDEVTESWGYYPQELAHRSFYDFVSPKDTDRLAQLHRLLLDNIQNVAADQKRQTRLPRSERTTSDLFFDTLPERLLSIAKGSNTYSDTLHIKRRDGELELFNFKVYLGGGFGADLYNPDTYSKLYIVAIMSKHQYAVSTASFLEPARSNFTETGADSPMACDSPQNNGGAASSSTSMDASTTATSTPELQSSLLTTASRDGDRFQMFRKSSTVTGSLAAATGFSNSPPRLSGINYSTAAAANTTTTASSNGVANQPPVSPKINIAPTTNHGLYNNNANSSNRFFPKTGNTPPSNSSTSGSGFRTMSMNPITGTLPPTYYSRRSDPFIPPPSRFAPTPVAARATASYTHPTTQYFLQTSSSTLNAAASAAQTKTRGGPGYSFTPISSTRGATDDLAPNDRATGKTESNPKMEMSITSLLC